MPDLNIGFNEYQWNSVANIFGNELLNYGSADEDCTCETFFAARGGHNCGPMFWMSNFVALDFTQGKSRVGFAAKAKTLPVPGASQTCTPQTVGSAQPEPMQPSLPKVTAPGVS